MRRLSSSWFRGASHLLHLGVFGPTKSKSSGLSLVNIRARDKHNIETFGPAAPQYAERIFIAPLSCVRTISLARSQSGRVWSWVAESGGVIQPTRQVKKIAFCLRHWGDGESWEQTGAFDHMERLIQERGIADGCRTMPEIMERYRRLDAIFETVRREGRLRSMSELNPNAFREEGGVYVHLGPDGEPIFGGGGYHRFAMALVLELKRIPAQIGCVDPSSSRFMVRLRSSDA